MLLLKSRFKLLLYANATGKQMDKSDSRTFKSFFSQLPPPPTPPPPSPKQIIYSPWYHFTILCYLKMTCKNWIRVGHNYTETRRSFYDTSLYAQSASDICPF